MTDFPKGSPAHKAIHEAEKDRTVATELAESANVADLHALCVRMIDERETIAKGFAAVVQAWSLVGTGAIGSADATASVERIATEAMALAREVLAARGAK